MIHSELNEMKVSIGSTQNLSLKLTYKTPKERRLSLTKFRKTVLSIKHQALGAALNEPDSLGSYLLCELTKVARHYSANSFNGSNACNSFLSKFNQNYSIDLLFGYPSNGRPSGTFGLVVRQLACLQRGSEQIGSVQAKQTHALNRLFSSE